MELAYVSSIVFETFARWFASSIIGAIRLIALGTRVTPTPLEQKVYSNIYSGRERNIENVGRYANSWLVERYFWLTFKVMGIEVYLFFLFFNSNDSFAWN